MRIGVEVGRPTTTAASPDECMHPLSGPHGAFPLLWRTVCNVLILSLKHQAFARGISDARSPAAAPLPPAHQGRPVDECTSLRYSANTSTGPVQDAASATMGAAAATAPTSSVREEGEKCLEGETWSCSREVIGWKCDLGPAGLPLGPARSSLRSMA